MAERASTREGDEAKASPPDFDFKRIPEIVATIESDQAEIDKIMNAAKKKCAPIRERIANFKKEVGKQGCPREELAAALRERSHLRAAGEVRGMLTTEQQETFDRIREELGDFHDTALGAAASSSKH